MPNISTGGIKDRAARKHQEILEREQSILAVARDLLNEFGFLGLTMERIAEHVKWSKPTVYQHFASKEEIVLALAREDMMERNAWYERASRFEGRPRERMLACGLVSSKVYAEHMRDVELALFSHWLRQNASSETQLRMMEVDMIAHGIHTKIIQDAVTEGDLTLPESMRPENVEFALWSLTFGGNMILNANLPFDKLKDLRYAKLPTTIAWAGDAFMDGIGWGPRSSEWDYEQTKTRIHKEFFNQIAVGSTVKDAVKNVKSIGQVSSAMTSTNEHPP